MKKVAEAKITFLLAISEKPSFINSIDNNNNNSCLSKVGGDPQRGLPGTATDVHRQVQRGGLEIQIIRIILIILLRETDLTYFPYVF